METSTPNLISAGKNFKRIGNLLVQLIICGIVGFLALAYMLDSMTHYSPVSIQTIYGVSFGIAVVHIIIIIKIINNLFNAGDYLMGKSVKTSGNGSSNELLYEKYAVQIIIFAVVLIILYFLIQGK